MISASGGHGACVPYCGNCAEKRRCVSCTHGRYLQNYQCKSYKDANEPLVSMVKFYEISAHELRLDKPDFAYK